MENYDVDGIHFDDYFYPTTDLTFDAATYQASGSSLTQADWRRENVNKLVHDVYAAVKEANPDCLFGISPQGNVDINYNGQFADVRTWVSEPGYVDYICPQNNYGYRNGLSASPHTRSARSIPGPARDRTSGLIRRIFWRAWSRRPARRSIMAAL